ncbi:MAG: DUF4105 domain-containing protein [Elusimicrobiota bacterium]|nr:DUF4105 domain-containing protein [Elusimicrobiota bacterium]
MHNVKARQVFAWLLFSVLTCWGTMALVYSNLPPGPRTAAAAVFVIAALVSALFPRSNGRKIIYFLSAFALVLACWLALPPSNSRDWEPDVATLPYADVSGSTVTIHNIRNCDYRAETDYDVRHYDRTFKLGSLRSMDLFLVNWGVPYLDHAMLSFGFGGGEYVCISIETRKKKGEEYSSIRGFFKQYELTYVVADERDIVRLRTNYRKGEEVYLYRLKAEPELVRLIFLDYLRSINRLKDRPQWYNALTANCTTDIRKHIAPYYPKLKSDWRILASGYADEMVYELGVVDQTLPLQELKRRSHINERSKAAGPGPAYSAVIRNRLPGF